MSDLSSAIILHNYPQSPVAEKARVAFGIKGVEWHHVEIPRIPPKENLVTLTGGYRRTPVMQIGADVYCDSACVIMELEKRFPSPSFHPTADKGLQWCLSRFTDGAFFDIAVKLVLGSAGDNLPPDFAADRGRLYLGPDWAEGLKKANAELPHILSQMRAPLAWLEEVMSDGRHYLTGDLVSSLDAQVYYVLWFIAGRWERGEVFLSEFPNLVAWQNRVLGIGHGVQHQMEEATSIEIAAANEPEELIHQDQHDPQGLMPGMAIVIGPDVDGGEQPVEGQVVAADAHRIAIRRHSELTGNLNVHFPRAGYKIEVL